MHLDDITIKVLQMTPDEWEAMPEEQQARVQELKRKLKQYDAMLKTFVQKYSGKKLNHNTLEELLKDK